MAVITVNGQSGSGGMEVSTQVAQLLGADYVDQQVLTEAAAQQLGTTLEALPETEFYTLSMRDRIARLVQRALTGSAMAAGGDLFPGAEAILARPYAEAAQSPTTPEQEMDDARFLEVTSTVMHQLAQQGNVVILGRGSNIILKDVPGAIHVGFVAPLELRIRNTVERANLAWAEAEHQVQEEDRVRIAYFRKFFKADPNDPLHYHLMLNMERLDRAAAAAIVTQHAQGMQQ